MERTVVSAMLFKSKVDIFNQALNNLTHIKLFLSTPSQNTFGPFDRTIKQCQWNHQNFPQSVGGAGKGLTGQRAQPHFFSCQ